MLQGGSPRLARSRTAKGSVLLPSRPLLLSHSNLLLRLSQGRTHSRATLTPTVFLLALWVFPSHTHTHGPLHFAISQFFTLSPPHTRDLAHSQSHPQGPSPRTRALARAPASSSHHRPLQGSTLPASSSQPPRLSRALRPTRFPAPRPARGHGSHARAFGCTPERPRAAPEPAPHLLCPASYLLVARSCQDARSRRRPGGRSSPAHATSLAPDRDSARRQGTRLGAGAPGGVASGHWSTPGPWAIRVPLLSSL